MSQAWQAALRAASDVAASQDYPRGALYMVATPIGNLADIGLRALHLLQQVDAIACEDTRHTQSLLRAIGIDVPRGALLAVHQHNEAEAAQGVLSRLQAGERVAYVSDAGTPAISDPGARLAAVVQAAGLRVVPLPGASSVTAALSAAGQAGATSSAFVFQGFLSAKPQERDAAVLTLAHEPRTVVLFEAPHRIEALARSLAAQGRRPVTLARELTKQFETIATLACAELGDWLAADTQRTRGEFVLVLHAWADAVPAARGEGERVLRLLLAELPLKTAVRVAAEITGEPRNALYEQALRLRQQAEGTGEGTGNAA